MKRPILFRGKRQDSGEWIYGWLIQHENLKYYILWYDSLTFRWKKNEVIEDTIGQYTGLTDKNGIKIFEGDIVSFKRGVGHWTGKFITTNHLVCWDESVARFSLGKEPESIKFRQHPRYEYVVIGNIHDNPELSK